MSFFGKLFGTQNSQPEPAQFGPQSVIRKRFKPSGFTAGYDPDEVDDFLDEVVVNWQRALSEDPTKQPEMTSRDIEEKQFHMVWLSTRKHGYRVEEVDEFLDQIVAAWRAEGR